MLSKDALDAGKDGCESHDSKAYPRQSQRLPSSICICSDALPRQALLRSLCGRTKTCPPIGLRPQLHVCPPILHQSDHWNAFDQHTTIPWAEYWLELFRGGEGHLLPPEDALLAVLADFKPIYMRAVAGAGGVMVPKCSSPSRPMIPLANQNHISTPSVGRNHLGSHHTSEVLTHLVWAPTRRYVDPIIVPLLDHVYTFLAIFWLLPWQH
mmetsp:Transcript_15544/g.20953  ORF Transcript_15544/g.20953 Transcript_15544/m.20953 type:complete len:210 (-) Transcript_15544:120-749(-)